MGEIRKGDEREGRFNGGGVMKKMEIDIEATALIEFIRNWTHLSGLCASISIIVFFHTHSSCLGSALPLALALALALPCFS